MELGQHLIDLFIG